MTGADMRRSLTFGPVRIDERGFTTESTEDTERHSAEQMQFAFLASVHSVSSVVLSRKCAIARFVRQTRTITYEKSENSSRRATAPVQSFARTLRQTRTRSERYGRRVCAGLSGRLSSIGERVRSEG